MTSSAGTGSTDDSSAISTMIPGYPSSNNRCSSQSIIPAAQGINPSMNRSSIEAVLPEQRDEPSITERRALELTLPALDQGQDLRAAVSQRDEQAAPRRQLFDEWRRDLRASRCDQNGIVWGVGAPPQRAVAQQHRGFGHAGRAQRPLGLEGNVVHAFDAEYLRRQGAQQGRLIA